MSTKRTPHALVGWAVVWLDVVQPEFHIFNNRDEARGYAKYWNAKIPDLRHVVRRVPFTVPASALKAPRKAKT